MKFLAPNAPSWWLLWNYGWLLFCYACFWHDVLLYSRKQKKTLMHNNCHHWLVDKYVLFSHSSKKLQLRYRNVWQQLWQQWFFSFLASGLIDKHSNWVKMRNQYEPNWESFWHDVIYVGFLTEVLETFIVAMVIIDLIKILFVVAFAVMACCNGTIAEAIAVSTKMLVLFLQLPLLPVNCCFVHKKMHHHHLLIVNSAANFLTASGLL